MAENQFISIDKYYPQISTINNCKILSCTQYYLGLSLMDQHQSEANEPLVINIKDSPEPIKIESLCVLCGKNGQTILLLTKIPFFKQMLVGSFSCQACGKRNNEVQFVGELPSKGISITFKVTELEDLNRQVIKSQHACIKFEQMGLQIPSVKKAEISTIEGILLKVQQNLQEGQQYRKQADYDSYLKIQSFINKIGEYKQGKVLPFTVNILDPSGNSYVKNPFAPKLDHRLFITHFTRTKEQIQSMGYSYQNALEQLPKKQQKVEEKQEKQQKEQKEQKEQKPKQQFMKQVNFNESVTDKDFLHNQPSVFEIDCHACNMPGLMKLCKTNIPHFSDLIIMSFSCDFCGAHQTDTKYSGNITDKCTTMTLKVNSLTNLKRDVFKSESCAVKLPELDIQLDYGTLGGVYTTVEGLLQKIQDHMKDLNPYQDSDSDNYFSTRMRQIVKTLSQMREGIKQFTLILRDPLSNTFIQNPYHPQQDKDLHLQIRDRNEQQNDYLGITQMSV